MQAVQAAIRRALLLVTITNDAVEEKFRGVMNAQRGQPLQSTFCRLVHIILFPDNEMWHLCKIAAI